MPDIGGFVNGIGGAVQDIFFTGPGARAEASSLRAAAQAEGENADLETNAVLIQNVQLQRKIAQSEGSTQAQVEGNGFTMGGSALDILRSSAQQGALAHQVVNEQGQIKINSYKLQEQAYEAQAKAADAAASAADIGAVFKVIGAVASLASG